MTDSTIVFPPGFRIPDTAGNPLPGAILYFYDAGTTTPKTVYSNSTLATSIGTSVTADSAGYPSASAARVLIYTGTAAYKIVCRNSAGTEQWTHDNIKGAVDTSTFLTVASTTVTYTVTPVTTGGTWVVGDVEGVVFEANPAGGNFTRTLPLASTATGVPFDVVHSGASGIVTLLTQGSDLMLVDGSDTARKALLLVAKGESVRLISNGVNWRAFFQSRVERALAFAVEDLRTAPAGSPVVGGYYLLNGAPSGAFTSTSPACAANDIVMYDGQSNYQIFRPSTDCGWIAFDKATDTNYQYRGSAWVSEAASNTQTGTSRFATQTEMETGTSLVLAASPGNVQYHPGVAKAWVTFTGTGTVTITASHNVSSITDNGTGDYTINFTTAFSSAAYGMVGMARYGTPGTTLGIVGIRNETAPTASACRVFTFVVATTPTTGDMATVSCAFFGDQ